MSSLLKQQTLDDEGLATLACEIESIMNGRPITSVSDDPMDIETLTPNHLLLFQSNTQLPMGVYGRDDLCSRRRWRQIQYLADIFWRRWTREYLPQLQERQTWSRPRRNICVGDLVLLVDNVLPRNCWSMGRVTKTLPNMDGHVRRVQVCAKSSTFERPIDKLILLNAVPEYEQN